MKAAICYEFGQPLVIEEVKLDPPQAGEVRVRVAACAICHSDVHQIRGEWGGATPVISGHEAAGTVIACGPGVSRVRAGDHVVLSLLRQCGHCFQCTIGRPYNCEHAYALDSQHRLHTLGGTPINQGIRCAAFAEEAVVEQSQVVKIPDDLPMDVACLLACGVITGLGAVTNTVQVETGSTVVVIGTGGVGLNAVQGAALSGASLIAAVDLLPNKLEAARSFGATHTINAREENVVERVLALTGGRGADYAFATVGSPRAIEQAVQMVRKGGSAVIVGMPGNDEVMISINAHHITQGRTIRGSNMGSTRLLVDIPRLVQLYKEGRLKLDELISGRYPLAEINAAIESMERGEALRNVIVM